MSAAHLDTATVGQTIQSLVESLGNESRLLGQLEGILRDQRAGVAENDVEKVDESVHAAHRILQTLGEARNRRQTLVHLLTDRNDVTVDELGDALGAHMTPELSERSRELGQVARSVSAEVSLNRSVLTRAIETGNEYVQRLITPTSASYGEGAAWTACGREPALINQRV